MLLIDVSCLVLVSSPASWRDEVVNGFQRLNSLKTLKALSELRLRTRGYVEINGMHDAEDLKPHLIEFLTSEWGCKEYTKYMWESSENYCDLKYTAPSGLRLACGCLRLFLVLDRRFSSLPQVL